MERTIWLRFQVIVKIKPKVFGLLQNRADIFRGSVLVTGIREDNLVAFRCRQMDTARREAGPGYRSLGTAGSSTPLALFLAHNPSCFPAPLLFGDDDPGGKDVVAQLKMGGRVLDALQLGCIGGSVGDDVEPESLLK
jgi:hypothetical protein